MGRRLRTARCELLGTEFGMFRNDGSPKPITLDDLSTEDLKRLLGEEPEPPVQ